MVIGSKEVLILISAHLRSPANARRPSNRLCRWKLATELAGTPSESTLIVAKADDGLKVEMEGALATGNVDNVTFSDSVLKFDVTFQKAAGPSTLRFTVKVNGDRLQGSFDSDFGGSSVTGKLEE